MRRASPALSSTSSMRMASGIGKGVGVKALGLGERALSYRLGSLTMLNQKSSIDLTTVMNCSRSTGFVT